MSRIKNTMEERVNLFPEHFGDPQKTLSPRGVRVAEILIGLLARISLPDPLA